MAAKDPVLRANIASCAAEVRWGKGPAVAETRQQLRADALERHIRRVVDAAPPLTNEQRDRLALLLGAPRSGGAAA